MSVEWVTCLIFLIKNFWPVYWCVTMSVDLGWVFLFYWKMLILPTFYLPEYWIGVIVAIITQIYKGDPRTCTIFISACGSNWGPSSFPVIKITVVRQVPMSPASTVVWAWRLTCVKHRMERKERGYICFAFVFACVVSQDPKTPNLSPWLTTPLHEAGSGISLVYLLIITKNFSFS